MLDVFQAKQELYYTSISKGFTLGEKQQTLAQTECLKLDQSSLTKIRKQDHSGK